MDAASFGGIIYDEIPISEKGVSLFQTVLMKIS